MTGRSAWAEPREQGTFTIREVRPDECAALGELIARAYLTLPADREAGWYFDEIRKVGERAAAVPVLAAVDGDGRLLGGVTYVPGPGPYAESEREDEAGFRTLGVAPDAQRRGIGGALVEACIARARADGRRMLVLLTRPHMTAARRLYERLGFRRAPERDWEPEPGIELLGYELEL